MRKSYAPKPVPVLEETDEAPTWRVNAVSLTEEHDAEVAMLQREAFQRVEARTWA